MKQDQMLSVTAGGSTTQWTRAALTRTLADVGFALDVENGRTVVPCGQLADACEAYLDKTTDEGVIALYEIADTTRESCNADALVVVRAEPATRH